MAKILLVEDDTNLSEIYQARMEAEGYTVVGAPDGESALALAAKEKPDLIISDVMMPKISGFEMLDILRNTDGLKHTRVIMLTALGQAEDRTRAEALGADKYLVKSQVTLEDIVSAAQELLGDAPDQSLPSPAEMAAPTITAAPAAAQPVAVAVEPVQPAPTGPLTATVPAPITEPFVQPIAAAPVAQLAQEPVVQTAAAQPPVMPVAVQPQPVSVATPPAPPVSQADPAVQPVPDGTFPKVLASEAADALYTSNYTSNSTIDPTGSTDSNPVINLPDVPAVLPTAVPTAEVAPLTELLPAVDLAAVKAQAEAELDTAVRAAAAEPAGPPVQAPVQTPIAVPPPAQPQPQPVAQTPVAEVPEAPAADVVPAPEPTPALQTAQATQAAQVATPAATATQPPASPQAIDEQVVANAVDKLLAKAPQSPTGAAIAPGAAVGPPRKKIIAPIDHPPAPTLQELLAMEAAKDTAFGTAAAVPAVAAVATAVAIPAASSESYDAAAAELLAKAKAEAAINPQPKEEEFDPNSISL